MTKKGNYYLLFGGILLPVVAIGLFLNASSREKNTARAADTTYTTTWNATKVIMVKASSFFSNIMRMEVPIGVAEWQAEGREKGTNKLLYTEKWSVPG